MKDSAAIKQCFLNAVAVFKHYNLPVPYAVAMQSDRTMFAYQPKFIARLYELVPHNSIDCPLNPKNYPVDFDNRFCKCKFETWPFNRNHGVSAKCGWRERVPMYSMQIVEHDYGVLEVDFDVFNPNHGVAPMVVHLGECVRHYLFNRKTNPFMIAKGLRKRGIDVSDAIWNQITLDAGAGVIRGT